MKEEHRLTRFKSLKVALKELEPFVKNGQQLRTGKPFKRFGDMRSREMLANWLLCVTINAVEGGARDFAFWSDPHGGDGIIRDQGPQLGVRLKGAKSIPRGAWTGPPSRAREDVCPAYILGSDPR